MTILPSGVRLTWDDAFCGTDTNIESYPVSPVVMYFERVQPVDVNREGRQIGYFGLHESDLGEDQNDPRSTQ